MAVWALTGILDFGRGLLGRRLQYMHAVAGESFSNVGGLLAAFGVGARFCPFQGCYEVPLVGECLLFGSRELVVGVGGHGWRISRMPSVYEAVTSPGSTAAGSVTVREKVPYRNSER